MNKSCLVVDDSPIVRRVARHILQKLDYTVDEAENGQIALDKCVACMPGVILLDWNMPVLNGIDFLRQLRSLDQAIQPRVIFCTTERDVEYIREAFEAGTDEYIMKPFDAEMIRAKLG